MKRCAVVSRPPRRPGSDPCWPGLLRCERGLRSPTDWRCRVRRALDARCQHDARRLGAYRGSGRRAERIECRALERQQQARVGAELADAEHQRIGQVARNGFAACGQRFGQQEDRVDAAHLRIDGDRLGTIAGDLHQRQATAARTREANRLDGGMGNQFRADRVAGAGQQREHAFGQAGIGHRLADCAADQLGCARVRGMGLGHDRAAGCQRRGGIAAGDREGEREVAGTEHRHGPDRNPLHAQVGARRRALRQRAVERGCLPPAGAQHGGEQA